MKNGSPLGQAHVRPTCLSRYSTSQGKHHDFLHNARLSSDADPRLAKLGSKYVSMRLKMMMAMMATMMLVLAMPMVSMMTLIKMMVMSGNDDDEGDGDDGVDA